MIEKFIKKDAKKEHFNNRMEFRKKSDMNWYQRTRGVTQLDQFYRGVSDCTNGED